MGRAPFVTPSGSWLPLRHPAGTHKIGGQTAQEGEAAASDGNPVPGDGKPATPKPSRLSSLWSICRVCPKPADASINGQGINDQGTYSGGLPGPAAPAYGAGGCRRGKAASGQTPTTHRAQSWEFKGPLPAPQRPPLKVREFGVGPAPVPARVCRSTRPGLAGPHNPLKHPSETPVLQRV